MRRYLIAILLLIGSLSAAHGAEKNKPANCRAPELIGYAAYDDLACAGIAMMARHDYRRAIDTFEKALKIDIFEWPNFMLFPRLALAYHEVGNEVKAAEMLEKGKLTLQVLTKILACVEMENDRTVIVYNHPGEVYILDSPYHEDIVNLMCGGAYESIYRSQNLEYLVGDGPLLRNYVAIKKKIEGKK